MGIDIKMSLLLLLSALRKKSFKKVVTKYVDQYIKLKGLINRIELYKIWRTKEHNNGYIVDKLKTMCGLGSHHQIFFFFNFTSQTISTSISNCRFWSLQLKETRYDAVIYIITDISPINSKPCAALAPIYRNPHTEIILQYMSQNLSISIWN